MCFRKVKLTYSDFTSCIKTKLGRSGLFKSSSGVKQESVHHHSCLMPWRMKLLTEVEEKTGDLM